jgi:hypothetical protein
VALVRRSFSVVLSGPRRMDIVAITLMLLFVKYEATLFGLRAACAHRCHFDRNACVRHLFKFSCTHIFFFFLHVGLPRISRSGATGAAAPRTAAIGLAHRGGGARACGGRPADGQTSRCKIERVNLKASAGEGSAASRARTTCHVHWGQELEDRLGNKMDGEMGE